MMMAPMEPQRSLSTVNGELLETVTNMAYLEIMIHRNGKFTKEIN